MHRLAAVEEDRQRLVGRHLGHRPLAEDKQLVESTCHPAELDTPVLVVWNRLLVGLQDKEEEHFGRNS